MYIVKSAILLSNGEIVDELAWYYRRFATDEAVYGFIDECGNFHDRKDAMRIATASGQIISTEEELYAEDLWPEPQLMEE